MAGQLRRFVRKRTDLWPQITGRNSVVAIKFDIIKGCGDAVPTRHGGGFRSANTRHGNGYNIAKAQGLADQNDFKLDGGTNCQLPGAQKIDSGGADIASDKRYRKFLGHSTRTAKTQREVQAGTRVFALLRMHAHGVRRDSHETPALGRAEKRLQTQRRDTRRR